MCRLEKSYRFKIPKENAFVAYKVFSDCSENDKPRPFGYYTTFEFGINVWDQQRANNQGSDDQAGFQMFAHKDDAIKYAGELDFIAEVYVQTIDVAKVGKERSISKKAYEVKKFNLTRDNWDKRIQKRAKNNGFFRFRI